MATERFYNLKPKKKHILVDSILNCVQNIDIDALSIVDIANESEISRGTFYTYFKDKHDAIYTMFYYKMQDFIDKFKEIITNNKGDFFKSVNDGFVALTEFFEKGKYFKAIKNILRITDLNSFSIYAKNMMSDFRRVYAWIFENSNLKSLGIKDEKQTKSLTELVFSLYASMLSRLAYDIDVDSIKNDFKYKLSIIERGVI